jgi:type II secretory pathway component PulJ
MSQAPDSLEAPDPGGGESGATMATSEGQQKELEGGIESPPQFDRVADVLGPLERVVLAADQQIGTIQQRVSSEAGDMTAQAEKKIREASDEQRRRVADLRAELTDRVSELATRFDAMLTVLDEVDRALAVQGGWSNGSSERTSGDVKVTVTERHRVEIAHDAPGQPGEKAEEKQAAAPAEGADASPPAVPGAPPGAAPSSVSPPVGAPPAGADDKKQKKAKKEKRKSFSFLRRSKSKPS